MRERLIEQDARRRSEYAGSRPAAPARGSRGRQSGRRPRRTADHQAARADAVGWVVEPGLPGAAETSVSAPTLRYDGRNVPGVYVSYPFCAQKCTYCNFASGVLPRELEPRYLEALEREICAHPWEWLPETVYLGGGTPSNLDPQALRAHPRPHPRPPLAGGYPGSRTRQHHSRKGPRLDRCRHRSRQPRRPVFRRYRNPPNRPQAHRRHRRRRNRRAPPCRHRSHQYRPDRRTVRPDAPSLERIARLDRATGARPRLRLHAGGGR